MSFRAVSFDLFDTLVDLFLERMPPVSVRGSPISSTAPALHEATAGRAEVDFEAFAGALRAVDRAQRERVHVEGREFPTRERFRQVTAQLGIDDPELPEILTRVHMGALRSHAETPDHHPELLRALRRRARLGVCSNFTHAPTAHTILVEGGLRDHLDSVVISEEVGLRKPRREIFEATLEGLGSAPEQTLHVGDNLRADVAGASALGIRTVWITRRVADPEAALGGYEGPRPDWIVEDLGELLSLLDD